MDNLRLDIRLISQQSLNDFYRLPDTTRNEGRKESDVIIRNMMVCDTSRTTVSDMMFCSQVFGTDLSQGAIRRYPGAISPTFCNPKPAIQVDEFRHRLVLYLECGMALVGP